MYSRILISTGALVALLGAGAAEPKVRFVPQPDLKVSGFWAERLDRMESAWIPHCWKRLGVHRGAFQRNLAEATMMALERHPERKDLADILETNWRRRRAACLKAQSTARAI